MGDTCTKDGDKEIISPAGSLHEFPVRWPPVSWTYPLLMASSMSLVSAGLFRVEDAFLAAFSMPYTAASPLWRLLFHVLGPLPTVEIQKSKWKTWITLKYHGGPNTSPWGTPWIHEIVAHPSRTSIGVSPSVRTEHPTRVPQTPCQPCIYHRSPHILVGSYGTPPPVGVGLGRPASTVPVGTGREWMMVALVPLCWPLQNPGMLLHCEPRTWGHQQSWEEHRAFPTTMSHWLCSGAPTGGRKVNLPYRPSKYRLTEVKFLEPYRTSVSPLSTEPTEAVWPP